MRKICTVVGARPQFIKLAVVSRTLRREFQEVLVHTGQHYDRNMSDVFFEEMDIPRPDYNLGISGGSHGEMTGQMLIEIERVLLEEKPDRADILEKLSAPVTFDPAYRPFGGGRSAEKIVERIGEYLR